MTKAEQWSARVSRLRASGLGLKAFAAQEGVNPHTLEWWRRQLRIREEAAEGTLVAPRPRFVSVEITAEAPVAARGFVVQLGGSGHRIEVPADFDATALRRLVGALC